MKSLRPMIYQPLDLLKQNLGERIALFVECRLCDHFKVVLIEQVVGF